MEWDAPFYHGNIPTKCPHCEAPIYISGPADYSGNGVRMVFECMDSLMVDRGRIWQQDGSASFPHGASCVLLRSRLDAIRRARSLASAVESMCAGECGKDRVEKLALAFLREVQP